MPLLSTYPKNKNKKTLFQKDICTPIFTAALFTTAKTLKETKCPSKGEKRKCGSYRQWNIIQS